MFNFFRKKKPVLPTLKVMENWHGTFHYHLSYDGKKALCGNEEIMERSIKLSSWGYRGHLHETYCKECERLWKENIK